MRVARSDLVSHGPPVLLLALAAGFTAMTGHFSSAGRVVPRLLGVVMLVLCALDIASRGHHAAGRAIAAWLNPAGLKEDNAAPVGARARRQAVATGGVFGLVLVMVVAGVLPAVALFGVLAFRFGAGQGWFRGLWMACGMAALVWLLFSVLLGLAPYPGLLFGGDL